MSRAGGLGQGESAGESWRSRASPPRLFKQHVSAGETRGNRRTYGGVAMMSAPTFGRLVERRAARVLVECVGGPREWTSVSMVPEWCREEAARAE